MVVVVELYVFCSLEDKPLPVASVATISSHSGGCLLGFSKTVSFAVH